MGHTPDYARAEGGKRAVSAEPKHLGKNITVIAAMSIVGVVAAMYCTCTFNGSGFLAFIETFLIPELRPGQILIMDNVGFHVRRLHWSCLDKLEFRLCSCHNTHRS